MSIHIETRLLEREGRAVTNFDNRLPVPGSDLARQSLKDPYLFDFLGVSKEMTQLLSISELLAYSGTDFHHTDSTP